MVSGRLDERKKIKSGRGSREGDERGKALSNGIFLHRAYRRGEIRKSSWHVRTADYRSIEDGRNGAWDSKKQKTSRREIEGKSQDLGWGVMDSHSCHTTIMKNQTLDE